MIAFSLPVNRALVVANLSLLILYPIAWFAPLASAKFLGLLTVERISIVGGVVELWRADILLAMIVAVFAVVAPYFKTILLAAIHLGVVSGERWLGRLEFLGKLSMTDVFLIAVYIIFAKGANIGLGEVETAWGLYLFTALVLGSLFLTILTKRQMARAEAA